ncbi:MAG: CPBP family intramembrane glutamic endopeptidase [Lentisphaeria bacterium]
MSLTRYKWTRKAFLPIVLTWFILTMLIIHLITSRSEQLSALSMFWLSFIPLHAGAFGAALIVLANFRSAVTKQKALNLERISGIRNIFFLISLAFLLIPVTGILTYSTMELVRYFGYQPALSPVLEFLRTNQTPAIVFSIFVGAVIIAPLTEEIIFRLVVYEALSSYRIKYPAFITASLFAVLHQIPVQIPALVILGLILQHLRARYNSLWAPIVVHSAFNGTSLVILLLTVYHA